MIHKVGTNGKAGGCKKAINYILGEKDHNKNTRPGVNLIDGDPDMIIALEKTIDTKNTFIHTSLSFTQKETEMIDTSDTMLNDIINSYRTQLAAGLPDADTSRLASTAVRHDEPDGKMHVHLITLRIDLETGKSYQPFVKQRGDIQRFQDWNTVMQKEFNLENPNSIERQKSASWTKNIPQKSRELRDLLDNIITDGVKDGVITNRNDVINTLNSLDNIKVSRKNNRSISIKAEGHKRPIRLKGAFYDSDFTSTRNIEKTIREKAQVDYSASEQRLSDAMRRLAETSIKYTQKIDQDICSDTSNSKPIDTGRDNYIHMAQTPSAGRNNKNVSRRATMGSDRHNNKSERKVNRQAHNNQQINTPNHPIFNGVEFLEKSGIYIWQGQFGLAQIQINPEKDRVTITHGSYMEWKMGAELLKENGHSEARLTVTDEKSLINAIRAHTESGIKITGITLDGKELTKDEIRRHIHDYNEETKLTRNILTDGRDREAGQTNLDTGELARQDELRDRLIERQIDRLEQQCVDIDKFIEAEQAKIEREAAKNRSRSSGYGMSR